MIDIKKQIAFWHDSAVEDWAVANDLVDRGHIRHGLFFAHLALEKALKALVCRATKDLAPRLHNLVRLAEAAQIPIQPDQIALLAVMNAFNVEGRYPDSLSPPPSQPEAGRYIKESEEVLQWLIHQLKEAPAST
jgi:HEPN domain-containing protein